MMITPQLCAAARALASIDEQRLAKQAGLPVAALTDFERGISGLDAETLEAVKAALEHFGVEFLPENDGGAGVRLKFNKQETRQIGGWESEGGLPADDDVP